MDLNTSKSRGLARVRLKFDSIGLGEVVVNGVHMESVVASTTLVVSPGDLTRLTLEILVDQAELEAEDMQTVIKWLTPEEPAPLPHEWQASTKGAEFDKCRVCRQVRRVAAATCPGPLPKGLLPVNR